MSLNDTASAVGTDPRGRPAASAADHFLEEVLPNDFDWKDFVLKHPKSSLTVAAVAGYVIGRGQGREILSALSSFVSVTLAKHVNDWIGEDVL